MPGASRKNWEEEFRKDGFQMVKLIEESFSEVGDSSG
jgi:hypothetical protein